MALNATKTGDAIASFIQSNAPSPGAPVSADQLKILWEGIINILYTDLKSDAVINSTGSGTVTSGPGTGGHVITTDIGAIT
jgi:hypothetical protein